MRIETDIAFANISQQKAPESRGVEQTVAMENRPLADLIAVLGAEDTVWVRLAGHRSAEGWGLDQGPKLGENCQKQKTA